MIAEIEQLIKEVWNDYGGADEALNQAISFIRKVPVDNNKEIIETIPKKGYVLHAVISNVENEHNILPTYNKNCIIINFFNIF